MREKNNFKVGDKIEAVFGGSIRSGVITDLNPVNYPESYVSVRFEGYDYGSDTDFHGWPTEKLTRLVEVKAPIDRDAALKNGKAMADALIKREKEERLGCAYGMSETKIAERQRTVAATIVLASGLEVQVPDPVGKDWVLTKTVKVEGIHGFSVGTDAFGFYFSGPPYDHTVCLRHKEAICWMKDMRRIVEKRITKGPFDVRYAYVTELRFFEERPPVVEIDDPAYPTLKAYLW